jgi:hypothetical protein
VADRIVGRETRCRRQRRQPRAPRRANAGERKEGRIQEKESDTQHSRETGGHDKNPAREEKLQIFFLCRRATEGLTDAWVSPPHRFAVNRVLAVSTR